MCVIPEHIMGRDKEFRFIKARRTLLAYLIVGAIYVAGLRIERGFQLKCINDMQSGNVENGQCLVYV